MAVNLSIKNVPEDLYKRLRERASRSHRSLQGELLAILEAALRSGERLTPLEILGKVREMKLRTPSEAAALVRSDRDAH